MTLPVTFIKGKKVLFLCPLIFIDWSLQLKMTKDRFHREGFISHALGSLKIRSKSPETFAEFSELVYLLKGK